MCTAHARCKPTTLLHLSLYYYGTRCNSDVLLPFATFASTLAHMLAAIENNNTNKLEYLGHAE